MCAEVVCGCKLRAIEAGTYRDTMYEESLQNGLRRSRRVAAEQRQAVLDAALAQQSLAILEQRARELQAGVQALWPDVLRFAEQLLAPEKDDA